MSEIQYTVRPSDFSDAGNASVFVREYCDDVIFTVPWLALLGRQAVGAERTQGLRTGRGAF